MLLRGRETDDAMAHRLGEVVGKPWAVVLDGALVVAKSEKAPSPRAVFGAVPVRAPNGTPAPGDLTFLLAAEADPERRASWLVLAGEYDDALRLAPADGPARRALAKAGRAERPPRAPTGAASSRVT